MPHATSVSRATLPSSSPFRLQIQRILNEFGSLTESGGSKFNSASPVQILVLCSLRSAASGIRWLGGGTGRSVSWGQYCRGSPTEFCFQLYHQGECGSQQDITISVIEVIRSCPVKSHPCPRMMIVVAAGWQDTCHHSSRQGPPRSLSPKLRHFGD